MTRRIGLMLPLALVLMSCAGKTEVKRYDMRGEVKRLDTGAKVATIAHEKIGDWMEAMTMDFSIKPDAEFEKLRLGDRIEAKVVVEDLKYYVTDIRVLPKQ